MEINKTSNKEVMDFCNLFYKNLRDKDYVPIVEVDLFDFNLIGKYDPNTWDINQKTLYTTLEKTLKEFMSGREKIEC
jgi:hypothetical protein